ncbi:hypothetical protein J6590_095602 [Homalodisca vitripennis]|nr:hypothetical protein J6590_095602 [Homalodisca vitripennis]
MVRILVSPTTRECDWHRGRNKYREEPSQGVSYCNRTMSPPTGASRHYTMNTGKGGIKNRRITSTTSRKKVSDRNRTVSPERLLRASMGRSVTTNTQTDGNTRCVH